MNTKAGLEVGCMTKNCEGCHLSTSDIVTCMDDNKKGTCPCTLCIVKVTCRIWCDKNREWVNCRDGD